MSDTYTKLFGSITASTIWQEPAGTRLTWITMLAMADQDGCIFASIPGLVDRAKVSRNEVEIALACFLSPDRDSRTKEHEGRRIEEIDGGWRLLNHSKFRKIRSAQDRAEYMREFMRNKRAKDKESLAEPLAPVSNVRPSDQINVDQKLGKPITTVNERLTGFEDEQRPGTPQPHVATVTAAGLIAAELNRAGHRVTSMNPDLIAAADEGVTAKAIIEFANLYPNKPVGYAIASARSQHHETPRSPTTGKKNATGQLSAGDRIRKKIADRATEESEATAGNDHRKALGLDG